MTYWKIIFTRSRLLLAAILILAFALRMWGINYGLPFSHENASGVRYVNIAARMGGTFNFNAHYISGGITHGVIHYILLFEYGLYFIIGRLTGSLSSVKEFSYMFIKDPTVFLQMGAYTSVVTGLLTILFLYFAGKRLSGKAAGLAAAFLLALSPMFTQESHLISADNLFMLWFTISLFYCIRVLQEGKSGDYVLAGVFAGIGIVTKILAGAAVLSLLTAHILRYTGNTGNTGNTGKYAEGKERLIGKKILLGLLSVGLGMIIADPYIILDFKYWIKTFFYLMTFHAASGWVAPPVNEWGFYLKTVLNDGGVPLTLLFAASLILAARRRAKEDLLLFTFPLLYYPAMAVLKSTGDRYLMPVFPFLYLLAARFLVWLLDRQGIRPIFRKAMLAMLLIILCISPLSKIALQDYRMSNSNTREIAARWIEENIPSGSKLLLDSFSPVLNDTRENIQNKYEAAVKYNFAKKDYYKLQLETLSGNTYDLAYIKGVIHPSVPYEKDKYELMQKHEDVGQGLDYIKSKGYEYIIVADWDYGIYLTKEGRAFAPKQAEFYDSLDAGCRLSKEIRPDPRKNLGPVIKIYSTRS